MSQAPDTGAEVPQSAAAKLFDLRVLIGGLFLVYGIMLTVAGFFTSSAEPGQGQPHQHQPVDGHRHAHHRGVLHRVVAAPPAPA